jgi:hypothetical protein
MRNKDMPEPSPITTITPATHWAESLVGDNTERLEAMKGYESPDAFFTEFDGLKNRDWRKEVAGDDDKFMSTLQRFASPVEFGNSFREAQQTIRSGKFKQPPGADASAEDIEAYREANGIPKDSSGYLQNLPDGLVIGEHDKPIVEDLFAALHAKNAPTNIALATIEWYNGFAEKQQEAQAEMDNQQSTEANDLLRNEWGTDYRANINLVNGLLESTFGKEAKDQLLNGRFGDGRAFMNDPKVLNGLMALARKTNPVLELGMNKGDPMQSLNDEISGLEKYMRQERHKYNNDVKAQDRLRQLYDIRIKQAERG